MPTWERCARCGHAHAHEYECLYDCAACRANARRRAGRVRAATRVEVAGTCGCECNDDGFCGGCGHAGCGH